MLSHFARCPVGGAVICTLVFLKLQMVFRATSCRWMWRGTVLVIISNPAVGVCSLMGPTFEFGETSYLECNLKFCRTKCEQQKKFLGTLCLCKASA